MDNYFAGLRYIEKRIDVTRHEDLFELRGIIAGGGVMDQGDAGRYRTINVRVGNHFPPAYQDVSALIFELIEWWNKEAPKLMLSPRQEQLLILLKARGRMAPSDIWDALGISRQGALKLMTPLLDAGLIVREGTRKSGYYRLKS